MTRHIKLILLMLLFAAVSGLTSCRSSKGNTKCFHHDRVALDNIRIGKGDEVHRKIAEEAYTWLGTPYKYAKAEKGRGTDCSGMVMKIYEEIGGWKIPRNSAKQAEFCISLGSDEIEVGDLVFFATGKNPETVSHVGIMLNNEEFIHASASKGVVISNISTPYYTTRFKKFGRIPTSAALESRK